jgi:cell filamentation protein
MGGNLFGQPHLIDHEMKRLFPRLRTPDFFPGSTADAFTMAAADFLAELNAIHPFREGNGRSQLSFLFLVALRAGHPLRLEDIQHDEFLAAMIRSFHGQNEQLVEQLRGLLA